MRTIIAGSRDIIDYAIVEAAVAKAAEHGIIPTLILSGKARGIDRLGERWAKEHNIPIEGHTALWTVYGNGAGRVRNEEMAKKADALIAIWDEASKGTAHMISMAFVARLKVYIYKVPKKNKY